jgi:hypothetical protein
MALELVVVDARWAFWARVTAWVKLLKVWLCLRFDDLQGIDWRTISVSDFCVKFRLLRSKTTGPGKKVLTVDLFLWRGCGLTGVDWFCQGLELFKLANFPRDYFLPKMSSELFLKVEMSYSICAGNSRSLLKMLGKPVQVQDGWEMDLQQPLCPGSVSGLWTEHSERHFLPSVAAALGEDTERRNYLGRWGIDRHASSDYVLSSRQIVLELQEKAVNYLHHGKPGFDEFEILSAVRSRAERDGHPQPEAVREAHTVLLGDPSGPGRNLNKLTLAGVGINQSHEGTFESLVQSPDSTHQLDHEVSPEASAQLPHVAPFWISVSKSGFRRLHKTGGCPSSKRICFVMIELEVASKDCADALCRHCYPNQDLWESSSESSTGDELSSVSASAVI